MCPVCGSDVVRIHRNRMDHLISAFVPVRRFQCRSERCGWQGLSQSSRPDQPRSKLMMVLLTVAVLTGAVVSVYIVTWLERTYQATKPSK